MTTPTTVRIHTKFETELAVRPDDIDMNRHVHNSRYFDYVLAARYDQMSRCYKMSMEEFLKAGFGWVVKIAHLEYKRPLGLGDLMIVRTWIDQIFKDGCESAVRNREAAKQQALLRRLVRLYDDQPPDRSGRGDSRVDFGEILDLKK